MGIRLKHPLICIFGAIALLFSVSVATAGDIEVVRIEGLRFNPSVLVIKPGTTVIWINLDDIDHDVTSGRAITGREARGKTQVKFPDGRFKSGTFGKGKRYRATFAEEGEYPYYCNIHPFMQGKIVVRSSP